MGNDSACRKNVYCKFRLSRDLPDATIEVCVKCSKKVIYRKSKGRIDNKLYLRNHIRDTVQPFGKTAKIFEEIYGRKPVRDLIEAHKGKKSKAQQQEEWEYLRRRLRK